MVSPGSQTPRCMLLRLSGIWYTRGAGLGNCTFAQSHVFALFKRVIVRSLFFWLFSKKRKSSDRTVALSKRVNERKCAKCEFPNRPFFLFKKSARTFQNVQLPNPGLGLRAGLGVPLLVQLLFPKERLCKNVWKKWEFLNCTFFALKKGRAIARFQNVRMPNPAGESTSQGVT